MAPSERRPPRSARSLPRAAVALGAALACASLAACNLLLGLDDYEKGAGGDDGGRPADAALDAAPGDAGEDASPNRLEAGPGTDPVTWASWPMPNWTSEAGTFPGAAALVAVTAQGATAYRDPDTALEWLLPSAGPPTGSLQQADEACAKVGGRVPRRIELVTLLDLEQAGSLPRARPGPALLNQAYWSSSVVRTLAEAPSNAVWTVDFRTGVVEGRGAGPFDTAGIVCLKGRAVP